MSEETRREAADAVIDVDSCVVIVVGAHPRAEARDRAVAYGLCDRLHAALRAGGSGTAGLMPLVVSDLWYLNDESLRGRATISVGAPGVNALAAYLADKVPSAFVIDDVLMVQLDVELSDLVASCWGVNPEATASAANAFCERYMDEFARAVIESGGERRARL